MLHVQGLQDATALTKVLDNLSGCRRPAVATPLATLSATLSTTIGHPTARLLLVLYYCCCHTFFPGPLGSSARLLCPSTLEAV